MRTILLVGDFCSVVSQHELLIRMFNVPLDDPSYMPIPRDLSNAKREMFINWIKKVNKDEISP